MGPTKGPGPTKPSPIPPKMTPDMIPQKGEPQAMMTFQPSYKQELENIKKVFKEGFNRLYGGLENLVNYVSRVAEKTEEAHRRIDGLEGRLDKVEKTLEEHEKRITTLENEITDLKNYIEERFKQVDEKFGYVKEAISNIAEAVSQIPYQYAVIEEAKPGEPGAMPTPDGRWIKITTATGLVKDYKPVKEALSKVKEYNNKI